MALVRDGGNDRTVCPVPVAGGDAQVRLRAHTPSMTAWPPTGASRRPSGEAMRCSAYASAVSAGAELGGGAALELGGAALERRRDRPVDRFCCPCRTVAVGRSQGIRPGRALVRFPHVKVTGASRNRGGYRSPLFLSCRCGLNTCRARVVALGSSSISSRRVGEALAARAVGPQTHGAGAGSRRRPPGLDQAVRRAGGECLGRAPTGVGPVARNAGRDMEGSARLGRGRDAGSHLNMRDGGR